MSNSQQIIANGESDRRSSQIPGVGLVFGDTQQSGDKALMAVNRVRFIEKHGYAYLAVSPARTKRVATIELDQGQVRTMRTSNRLHLVVVGILLGAWNLYWLLRSVRALREKTRVRA